MENGYEKLADRRLLLESNLHAIQIISKDKKTSLIDKMKSIESYENDKNKKLIDLMKSLESFTVQGIQTLQRAVSDQFQALEDVFKTEKKKRALECIQKRLEQN